MLKYLRYRYAKIKMAAYINGELPIHTRRFIGRLINDDERVYREYIRQRQTQRDLERQLPTFGRPDAEQLDSMWANIQTQLNTPETPAVTRQFYSLSYGVALGLCVMALMILLTFDSGRASAAVSARHLPETVEFTTPDTPPVKLTSVAVAGRFETLATDEVVTDLQNTPAPQTPGQ
jgi:anti-sigma factor RsiW